MCTICDNAMAVVVDAGDGATAFAWSRADAAIKAWRAASPDLEFDSVLDECEAWADHAAATADKE